MFMSLYVDDVEPSLECMEFIAELDQFYFLHSQQPAVAIIHRTKMSRSVASASTVLTVDDALDRLSMIEEQHGESSLADARQIIRDLCGKNSKLTRDAIDVLHSPSVFFGSLCANSVSLLSTMFKCNCILGGIQATSLFFPIAGVTDAPWDFYCGTTDGDPDRFISEFAQITMFTKIEDIKSTTGERTVHFRGNVNGTPTPVMVRIFVAHRKAMESILELTYSYQQSYISAVGAVCYWPRLGQNRQYRIFSTNSGLKAYPTGKSKPPSNIRSMKHVTPRTTAATPSIYTANDSRIQIVAFKNEIAVADTVFAKAAQGLDKCVYAVHNTSTRYLGHLGGME
jgi:hypothetical protein